MSCPAAAPGVPSARGARFRPGLVVPGLLVAVLALALASCGDLLSPPKDFRIVPFYGRVVAGDTARLYVITGSDTLRTGVSWSSSDTAVAQVDGSGLVRARRPGSVSIRASSGGGSASSGLVVVVAPTSCTGVGTAHGMPITADETWRRADGPHHVIWATVGARLTIEPGTLICLEPDAEIGTLPYASLQARGRPDAPIVFTARDPRQPWGGISFGIDRPNEVSHISNAVIEYAKTGVESRTVGEIDSVRLRQIVGAAVDFKGLNGGARIAHSVVDTAGSSGTAAVVLRGATLEATTIRGARGAGLWLAGGVSLLGARIEGSAGVGIEQDVIYPFPQPLRIVQARPLRVTGGGSYPLRLPLSIVRGIWSRPEDQDSLLGNARDTLVLLPDTTTHSGELVVRRGLPWAAPLGGGSMLRIGRGAHLTVEPGSALTGSVMMDGAVLTAVGGAQAPVTLRGTIVLRNAPRDTSRIGVARLDSLFLYADSTAPVTVEATTAQSGSALALLARGSRLTGSLVSGGRSSFTYGAGWSAVADAGVVLGAGARLEDSAVRGSIGPGVIVTGADAALTGCELSFASQEGVRFTAGRGLVRGCNLFENGGPGVTARSVTVDARGNWWGDPAGPAGPAGDGAGPGVDASGWLTAPAAPGVTAASIRIVGTGLTVATADTLRLQAMAGDAAGRPLPAERFDWSVSDAAGARYDSAAQVLVGVRPGAVIVTAVPRSNAALFAQAVVTIAPGAPALDWAVSDTFSTATGLWGRAPDDVIAVSLGGRARHFDGTRWTALATGTTNDLWDVAGSPSGHIWAVGRPGTVLRYDVATGWRSLPGPSAAEFLSVVPLGGDSVLVGGADGVWLWDGSAWRRTGMTAATMRLTRAPDGTLYALAPAAWSGASSAVYRFTLDGAAESLGAPTDLAATLCATSDGLYSVGRSGAYRWDGHRWSAMDTGTRLLTTVMCAGEEVWGLGYESTVRWRDPATGRWFAVWPGVRAELRRGWIGGGHLFLTGIEPTANGRYLIVHARP